MHKVNPILSPLEGIFHGLKGKQIALAPGGIIAGVGTLGYGCRAGECLPAVFVRQGDAQGGANKATAAGDGDNGQIRVSGVLDDG